MPAEPPTTATTIAANVRALHFLSGALMWDTITGDDLNRLLHSISAIATARRLELNDQELAVEQAHHDLARAAA